MILSPVRDVCDEVKDHDVVIVGSGLAGLSAALGLQPRSIGLLTKGERGSDGASSLAQGGIAAAWAPEDSASDHARDTMSAGAGLCEEPLVVKLTGAAPGTIERLVSLGARFDRGAGGDLMLGREGAHGRNRVLHANGDATGEELVRVLVAATRQQPGLDVFENSFVSDLAFSEGRVVGVVARSAEGRTTLHTGVVVLASGGMGQLYLRTTSPREASGDGLALAARAGASLADLEFMQFHPTALLAGLDPLPLVSEAVRGEGATLIDGNGERFMVGLHEQAELAPRDVVARAIWRQQQAGHEVRLDASEAVGDRFPDRFPTVFAHCQRAGLDPRRQSIPVTPAAHYSIGGVATDSRGRTSLPGLWACGEVAASGVHGGNRLASNSLLEALVFGDQVARDIEASELAAGDPRDSVVRREPPAGATVSGEVELLIRQIMWEKVGLVRDADALVGAQEQLDQLAALSPGETANLHTVARLVTAGALARRESRGAHYRVDYPEPSESWRRRLFWRYDPEASSDTAPLVEAPSLAEGREDVE